MKARTKFLLLASLLAAAAMAQEAVISWKPEAGKSVRYKVEMAAQIDMGGQTGDMNFSMVMAHKVLKVSEEGVSVETKTSDMKVSVAGQEIPMGSQTFTTVELLDMNGERKKKVSDDSDMHNPRLDNVFVMLYPGKSLKPGDTWTRTVKGDAKAETVDAEAIFKYEGIVDGNWKITTTYTEKVADKPMKVVGTSLLDPKDGELIKGDYKFTNLTFDPSQPPVDATVKVTRLAQ